MFAIHCDTVGCDTWKYDTSDLDDGFVVMHDGDRLLHFCSWNCVAKYSSTQPWTERVYDL